MPFSSACWWSCWEGAVRGLSLVLIQGRAISFPGASCFHIPGPWWGPEEGPLLASCGLHLWEHQCVMSSLSPAAGCLCVAGLPGLSLPLWGSRQCPAPTPQWVRVGVCSPARPAPPRPWLHGKWASGLDAWVLRPATSQMVGGGAFSVCVLGCWPRAAPTWVCVCV